jgi:hypothetical protein
MKDAPHACPTKTWSVKGRFVAGLVSTKPARKGIVLAKVLLLVAKAVEVLLCLIAPNLILQGINLLLTLGVVDLLFLAQRGGLSLNSIDLLVRLQAL